jgi:hypothetical protein
MMTRQRAWTLKSKIYGLLLDWIIVQDSECRVPTHEDFKTKYGELYYAPFHKDEEIVELVEKV